MKKVLLLLVLSCTLVSTRVFAQNQIEIYDQSNNVVNGTILSVYSPDINVISLGIPLKVKNNTDIDLNVFVRRIVSNEVDSSSNGFCFGIQCYPVTVDTSVYATLITPGSTDLSFVGDYYPNIQPGFTSVTYEFYDNRSSSSPITAQVTVNYLVRSFGLGLEIYDELNNNVTDSTISIYSPDLTISSLDIPLKVRNNTSQDLNLFVRRIINSEVPLSSNAFCFGIQCYGTSIDTSVYETLITPGAMDISFLGDYYPNLQSGLTSLTYEFFDNRNGFGSITAQLTVNYLVSPLGLGTELKSFDISAAYPNPSSFSTSIEYSIPIGSNGKIILRNLLGSVVREVSLEKSDGRAVINTSDLKDGLYFYSISLNNKIEVTRKLVIKH
jgi:hypothetical protein